MGEEDMETFGSVRDPNHKEAALKMLFREKYLKISCKTDLSDEMGSMFVIIKDEPEEFCEYRIINESANFDLVCQ